MALGQGGCQGEESLPGHLEGGAAGGQAAVQAHSTCGLPAGRIVAEDTKDTKDKRRNFKKIISTRYASNFFWVFELPHLGFCFQSIIYSRDKLHLIS